MSWMKRPKGGAPLPADQQIAAPQPYGNQQNAYPNYQSGVAGNNPPQQYWQTPPQSQPQYNQQYSQVYQHQADYGANANQYYQQQPQQPQFNQNYPNQTYNIPQQGYQQNYYQNQGAQQPNYAPNKSNDGWEDNWNWGWEDQSKAQKAQGATSQSVPQVPQQAFNNANVIEESFAATESWNWASEEKKEVKDHPFSANQGVFAPAVQNVEPSQDNKLDEASQHSSNPPLAAAEEVRTLNDTDVIKERLPNLALGKRFHIDNLTPQWSIESQMSQDSSDGPQTQSEGTFRSEMQSRNSDKSNCSQHSVDEPYFQNPEWSQQSLDEPNLADTAPNTNKHQNHNDLANSMQEMSITNKEIPAPDTSVAKEPIVSSHENVPLMAHPISSVPSNFPAPHPSSQVTQPPLSSQPPSSLPPPISASIPPPTSFPPSLQSTNPFKHAGPFSHKSTSSKTSASNPSSSQPFSPSMSSSSLTSPAVVNKASQHNRTQIQGFGANLETTPDNSERPDHPQVMPFRPMPVTQQVPDNLEVAPKSDRNEYLQTAHLSSGDYGENTDFSRNVPPPGLRRMVVGQQESEYNQTMNMSGDEPPPGLARMVPGQQNEGENIYNQSGDNYLDRHIDGQPTEGGARPYRQADGQQTPDNYSQPARADRRPIGLDRMVPGEPSNDEYPQYQAPSYASNEQRVVTGLDRDYPVQTDAGPSDVREQNVDGSDYTAQPSRNDLADFPAPEEQQREVIMEGENLQDLSIVSSTEMTYSRDHTLEGADMNATDVTDRKTDSDLDRPVTSSRRQSLNHVNTSGDDSERDRLFKNSPRRDKHRVSRDKDKEGRYSRGDRKFEREPERRSGREDRRRDRDESPDARRQRRSARHRRYDTEDTDYNSDRERERRRYREGSYTSKPPRPDDKERRYEDRGRRYNTTERERRYDDERDGRRRDERRDERRSERRYRDIDPTRKYGNLRRERDEEERRRDELGSPSRAESREPREGERARRGERRARHSRPYYDGHGYGGDYTDPYQLQRAQYQYYEHLRLTDPAAYMQVYKQLMAGQHPPDISARVAGFLALRDFQPEERGSVHSGRSSANDLKGHDTLYGYSAGGGAVSLRGAGNASMRTDLSDRDLNTDASLNLQLEESTVRSDRMTPFKYSTAHIKGSISSRDVVVVRPSYPVDGRPATVHVLALAGARLPPAAELAACPGVLLKGVTHKKSVIEYCMSKARSAYKDGRRDPIGYILIWELLALLLRQNGVVMGADIAELLMKNKREHEYCTGARTSHTHQAGRAGSRRESSLSGSAREDEPERLPEPQDGAPADLDAVEQPEARPADEAAALDRLRELLIYGNRQEAIEWAMCSNLWGHALQLSAHCERRTRLAVHARFVATLAPADPLHSLYRALQHQLPPAATCADGRADWRPHAAIMLSNPSASAEQDARALCTLGGSLAARGRPYCAQFCYLAAGAEPQPHPLQPLLTVPVTTVPRVSLLLADPRASSLELFASTEAIVATEIYEFARALNQSYVLDCMQTYKLIMAIRLCDVGDYERALAYVESAARAALLAPERSPRLLRALAELADRLKYHDPALLEEPGALSLDAEGEASPPRQDWLDDVKRVLHVQQLSAAPSVQSTPQHQQYDQQQYGWGEQNVQQQQYQPAAPYEPSAGPAPAPEDLAGQYYQPPAPPPLHSEPAPADYDPARDYWQPDHQYSYNDTLASSGGGEADAPRPLITMPGGSAARFNHDDDRPPSADQAERDSDTPKPAKSEKGKEEGKRGGWLGGILGKLALRAPHQMILPDDKDPAIVWDEQSKRWRNKDGDDDVISAPPPPPKMSVPAPALHRSSSPPLQAPPGGAPPPPLSNIFKMQKGRHIKKSYVDVLNAGGARGPAAPPPAPPPPPPAAPATYFVPQHQSGIYDPSQVSAEEQPCGL